MPPPRVLVVGDVMRDVVARPRGPVLRGTDQRAAVSIGPGGSGANQAAWLARFGVPVRFAACVGRDDLDAQTRLLRAHAVEPALAGHPTLPTGTLVALVGPDGERSFLTDRGANDGLRRASLPPDVLGGVAHLHVSGYALVGADTRATVLELLGEARRAGLTVSFDPGSAAFVDELGPARVLDWIGRAALCALNADEAAALTGTADGDAQLDRLAGRFGLAVLKRGAAGAAAARADGARWHARPRPAPVVDTVGAGDAFLAAFLARWLAGEAPDGCLRAAVEAGADAVTRVGGWPPRPVLT